MYYNRFVLAIGFGKMIKLGIGKIGPRSVTTHCAALKSPLISVDLRVAPDLGFPDLPVHLSHLESLKDKPLGLSRCGGRWRRLGAVAPICKGDAASPEAASAEPVWDSCAREGCVPWIAHQLGSQRES